MSGSFDSVGYYLALALIPLIESWSLKWNLILCYKNAHVKHWCKLKNFARRLEGKNVCSFKGL